MVIVGQLFADLFEQNDSIEGIQFHNIVNLLSQFADDTNIFVKNQTSLDAISQTLKVAEGNLGLKVNYDKTQVYCIGSLTQSNVEDYMQSMYAWSEPPVLSLGIEVITNLNLMSELNLKPLIPRVEAVLKGWRHRHLTLTGRVLVINTLVESMFVYRFSVLSCIDQKIIDELQQRIWEFVWKGKRARIKLDILKCPKYQGGLRLVDLRQKHVALLAQWVFNVESDSYLKASLYATIAPTLGVVIWLINAKKVIYCKCMNTLSGKVF